MSKKIAVVPGDGIGPEVIAEGMCVLERVNETNELGLEFVHFHWSADEDLRSGIAMPTGAMEDIREYAAVLPRRIRRPARPRHEHGASRYACRIRTTSCARRRPLAGRSRRWRGSTPTSNHLGAPPAAMMLVSVGYASAAASIERAVVKNDRRRETTQELGRRLGTRAAGKGAAGTLR